jgi:hypothetical protein
LKARSGRFQEPKRGLPGDEYTILLRRKLGRELAITDRTNPAQPPLGFAEVGPDKAVWEYAALVTSLDNEMQTLGQLYRDRADCEKVLDELKINGVGAVSQHRT